MSDSQQAKVPFVVAKFNDLFDNTDLPVLTFNPAWKNGTDYLDHLVYDDVVPGDFGAMAKFIDDYQRHALVLKTRFGNVVVFQRYSGGERHVLVANLPDEVRNLLVITGAIDEDQFFRLFSFSPATDNFALRFEAMLGHANDGTAWMKPWKRRKLAKAA